MYCMPFKTASILLPSLISMGHKFCMGIEGAVVWVLEIVTKMLLKCADKVPWEMGLRRQASLSRSMCAEFCKPEEH